MSDTGYYEVGELWEEARYLQPAELERFERSAALVPAEVQSILDVGAGNGQFLRVLETSGRRLDLTGVDRSAAAVKAAVCTSRMLQGSADKLPFDDRSFDLVSALEVVEHFPYTVFQSATAEMERVARNYILLSVPYREKLRRVSCPYCGCAFHPHYHMRRFDMKRLGAVFSSFRLFKAEKVYKPSTYPFLYPLLSAYARLKGPAAVYPATAVCPLCGYGSAERPRGPQRPAGSYHRVWNGVKRVLPRPKRPHWVIALYKRA